MKVGTILREWLQGKQTLSYYTEDDNVVAVVVCLATSPCGVSKSQGGGVPTSDIDRSGPRIRCYLYNFYSSSPSTTCFNRCSGSLYFAFYPTASPSVSVRRRITSLLNPSPTSSPDVKRCQPGLWPPSLPARILQPPPLVSAPWKIMYKGTTSYLTEEKGSAQEAY